MLLASFFSLSFWLPLFLAEACGLKPDAFRSLSGETCGLKPDAFHAAAGDSPVEITLAHLAQKIPEVARRNLVC